MSEFKVGDKVRRVNSSNGFGAAQIGQVATVVEAPCDENHGMVRVEYDGYQPYAGYVGEGWFPECTELVTDELPARFKFKHSNSGNCYDAETTNDGVRCTWGEGEVYTFLLEAARSCVKQGIWVITEVITEPTTAEALQDATDALAVAVQAAKDADAVEIELFDSYHAAKDRACNLRAARTVAENAHREALAKHYGIG